METAKQQAHVVLMAGGFGSRLAALTADCPKPLLHVGDKPLLQINLERLIRMGFHTFYFSVHYRSEMIEQYFGNGEAWGVDIIYIRETHPLGTAGCLALLPAQTAPLLVMNGDVLTDLDCSTLLKQHIISGYQATLCTTEQEWAIPYGVVHQQNGCLTALEEKPTMRVAVNAGIYILNPCVLQSLEIGERCDMPQLLDRVLKWGDSVGVYALQTYWLDIGHPQDYERANREYVQFQERFE